MGRAQAGDRDSYRALLERLAPLLHAMIARQFRNRTDVEDVAQEVLLTLHSIRHTYDPRRPFLPWFVTIVRRRIVDRLRRQGRSSARETRLTAEAETFAAVSANLSERNWSPKALQAAIDALPDSQRKAVTMLKLHQMSLKEAAAASGLSVAALKVATHRGIKRLRTILRGKGEA